MTGSMNHDRTACTRAASTVANTFRRPTKIMAERNGAPASQDGEKQGKKRISRFFQKEFDETASSAEAKLFDNAAILTRISLPSTNSPFSFIVTGWKCFYAVSKPHPLLSVTRVIQRHHPFIRARRPRTHDNDDNNSKS